LYVRKVTEVLVVDIIPQRSLHSSHASLIQVTADLL